LLRERQPGSMCQFVGKQPVVLFFYDCITLATALFQAFAVEHGDVAACVPNQSCVLKFMGRCPHESAYPGDEKTYIQNQAATGQFPRSNRLLSQYWIQALRALSNIAHLVRISKLCGPPYRPPLISSSTVAHKAQIVGFHGMEFALIPLHKVTGRISAV
jgi:hypothetical protein